VGRPGPVHIGSPREASVVPGISRRTARAETSEMDSSKTLDIRIRDIETVDTDSSVVAVVLRPRVAWPWSRGWGRLLRR
jgi:hypothetical protein